MFIEISNYESKLVKRRKTVDEIFPILGMLYEI